MLIIMTDEKLVRVFGLFAMSSLLVLRTIRWLNWNIPETKSQGSRW
jgi:hypothetical protein